MSSRVKTGQRSLYGSEMNQQKLKSEKQQPFSDLLRINRRTLHTEDLNMKKRVLSILLTLVMLIGMMPLAAIPAFAEGDTVSYLDEYGRTQSRAAADVTEITEGKEYGAGWYILKGNFTGEDSLSQITFTGETHLILADGADVTVFGGILLSNMDASLTIYAQPVDKGTGKLTVQDVPDDCAGIGAGRNNGCGNITINGGTVTATGGRDGAGIGGGQRSTCGNITINGGVVTATGGDGGTGIGVGFAETCGDIVITNGTVIANGSSNCAGIGSSFNGNCSGITITGGVIKATKGSDAKQHIGRGRNPVAVNVSVSDGLFDSGEDGSCRCINCMYWDAVPYCESPDKTKAYSLKEYFQSKSDGKYYFAVPFTPSNCIGDEAKLNEWLSAGGGGYTALHEFGEWETLVEATCTTPGLRKHICNDCGYSVEETVPATGHSFGDWVKTHDASEGSAGRYERECTVCHAKKEEKFFSVPYIRYGLDGYASIKAHRETVETTQTITSDSLSLETGWYVVPGTVRISERLSLSGDVKIILMDGAELTVHGGIGLSDGDTNLTIYAQSTGDNMGKLTVDSVPESCAGIGSNNGGSCGTIIIHGGNLTVLGGNEGAGIGSGNSGSHSAIGIWGGKLSVTGGRHGAGIGSGNSGTCENRSTSDLPVQSPLIYIYGGSVTAYGGYGAAGIGTGYDGSCTTINIRGGSVTAYGGEGGAGIGAGDYGFLSNYASITVEGYGTITATGGYGGAGIGGGEGSSVDSIKIDDSGEYGNAVVTATGGYGGAGIGGGLSSELRDGIVINGGIVTAAGGLHAAGIGLGYSGSGGETPGNDRRILINNRAYVKAERSSYEADYIGNGGSCHFKLRFEPGYGATYLGKYNAGYVNYEPFIDPDTHCVNAGYGTYFKDCQSEKYYSALPFTAETLISDLDQWKSEGNPGYIAPMGHSDENLDGNCDRCGTTIYERIVAVQQTCTEAGHAVYFENHLNDLYYTDISCTDNFLIGDEDALAAWLTEGGAGYIAPLGHKDDNADKLCDHCGAYFYYEFSAGKMTEEYHAATEIESSTSTLADGWYIVKGNVEIPGSLSVSGDVHLILADDATLTVKKGVLLTEGNSLTIYVQSFENHMGSLVATGNSVEHIAYSAGIGGYVDIEKDQRFSSGRLTVNGGNITATGADTSAGIGGSEWTDCSEVTINAGTVTATGGNGGAGIGGGLDGSLRKLTVNGGTVTARGGYGSAGIGGGLGGDGGQVQINGGTVKLYGGEESAAFGKAYYGDGSAATVRIGGAMEAYEIIDRPLSYDPSRTKEVLGDQLTVNADGTLAVGTCLKAIVWPITPNDGPVTPVDPIEHLHLGIPAPGLEPTKNSAGHKEYYQCSQCGKNFEDERCTVEITDLDAWKAKGGSGYLAPLSDKDDPTAPKTGDNSNIALWMTLFVLSSTVLCCCGIIGRKNEQ